MAEAKKWTDEEIEQLKKMKAQGKTHKEIGEDLGRTPGAITAKVTKLGIENYHCKRNLWSKEETEELKRLYLVENKTISETSKFLGRSSISIYDKLKYLGIVKKAEHPKHKCDICGIETEKFYTIWHGEDEYNGMSLCSKHYGQLNRKGEITDPTIPTHNASHKFTQEEIDNLIDLYKKNVPAKEIAERLNLNWQSVRGKISELGLPRKYPQRKYVDHTGERHGILTVIESVRDENGVLLWKCLCDCQKDKPESERKYTYIKGKELKHRKSCGCLLDNARKENGHANKKYNKYDLSGEFGKGWTESGYEFWFDKEDFDLIKPFCWHKHQDGYLRTCYGFYVDENSEHHNKYIMMHQLIAKKYGCEYELDHINGQTWDNRKEKLREAKHIDNSKNVKISSNNTSGVKGVCWDNRTGSWHAYITCDKERIYLGHYSDFDEAVKVRKEAEEKYFGEWNRNPAYL